jgi:hypothetical protein
LQDKEAEHDIIKKENSDYKTRLEASESQRTDLEQEMAALKADFAEQKAQLLQASG